MFFEDITRYADMLSAMGTEPRLRIISEGDTAIDDQPLVPIPVNIQVHPDFARTAERDKEERVWVAIIRPGSRLQRRMVHLLRFRR